jgi:hypothetical protein
LEQQNGFIFPDNILEEADAASFNLLPAKSKERYLNVLEKFRDWMRTKNFDVGKNYGGCRGDKGRESEDEPGIGTTEKYDA